VHLTSQQVAAKCLLRAGKIIFPCISRYDCFYPAIFALLAYLAREILYTDTQYTFPLYLSKHIFGSTGSVRESAKVQVFTSPLFPDRTFTSRHVVYLDIDFPSMGFSILQIMCRIMEDSDIQAQAPIIFGQDLISMYGILNYIIKPDKYCAVQPPAQAPEEFLDNDEHCVLPFPAASSASPRHRGTATSRNRCYH